MGFERAWKDIHDLTRRNWHSAFQVETKALAITGPALAKAEAYSAGDSLTPQPPSLTQPLSLT